MYPSIVPILSISIGADAGSFYDILDTSTAWNTGANICQGFVFTSGVLLMQPGAFTETIPLDTPITPSTNNQVGSFCPRLACARRSTEKAPRSINRMPKPQKKRWQVEACPGFRLYNLIGVTTLILWRQQMPMDVQQGNMHLRVKPAGSRIKFP